MNGIFQHKTTPSTEVPTADPLVAYDIDPAGEPTDKPIFYQRVRAHMIGLRILGSIDSESMISLELHQKKYIWTTTAGDQFYDGPTMLQICIEKVNPSTRVGISSLKQKLRKCTASAHDYNVRILTDKMKLLHSEILEKGSSHEDYVLDMFNALLTTRNTVFTQYIQREKDAWDTGKDIDADTLINNAVIKFDNMTATDTWSVAESGDAKIAALTTELKDLREKFALVTKNSVNNSNSSGQDKSFNSNGPIASWRFNKTLGESVERDGKKWHWCPHQHNNGKGMYVTHKPEDHTQWREMKEKFKKERQDTAAATQNSSSSANDAKKTLALSDKLKAAMVSKFKCSDSDADKLWSDIVKPSN